MTTPQNNPLPAWLDVDTWEAFVEMRKAKGKRAPFTEKARQMLLKKLQTFRAQGYDANACLEESVMNGWSGVFPPKLSTANQKTAPGHDGGPWWETRQGIEAKGVELGLGPWDQVAFEHGRGEPFPVYRERVKRKAHAEGMYDTEPGRAPSEH